MVVVFLLLTLLGAQIITLGLLNRLSAYFVRSDQQAVADALAGWAEQAAQKVPAAASGSGGLPGVEQYLQSVPDPRYSLWLLDASGACVWSSLSDCRAQPFTTTVPGMSAVALGQAGVRCAPAFGGPANLWCAVPVLAPNTGRLVGIAVALDPENGVYQTIPQIRAILLTWTLIALAVMGGLSLVVARTITGPIGLLTRHARAMAAGDFSTRLPVRSRDEVGQLAAVFNHLGHRLEMTLDEIRTEQRRAAAILENMSDGLLAVGPQGDILLCNAAAATLLARDPAALVGRPLAGVLPAGLSTALADGAEAAPIPVRAGDRHLRAHAAPLGDGPPARGWVVVLHDVTEAERLEAMRKEFVANVSHELRTPVTTVKLYAESLLEWGLDDGEGARDKVEVIAAETERMHHLIQNLLVLSRLDAAPRDGGDRAPTDIGALAAETASRFEAAARQKGIDLRVSLPRGGAVAPADREGITRVLSNLLANAMDFTTAGGRVSVEVRPRDAGGVVVEVADTGIGIPAEALPRIFERFYRVDASRSREYGGSGLGLAIAQEIVRAHGGWFEVESREGHGTRLRFTLPGGGGP
jgi:two-component system sensor histidine kinase VicK